MATATKKYLVAGIVVEATKSEGGGFYTVKILQTGETTRYLSDVFESVAEEINDDSKESNTGNFSAS